MAHRVDHATASPNMHGVGKPGFTGGSPVAGVPATRVPADWLNDLQENICRTIEAAGIELVKGDYGQLTTAILALIAASGNNIHVATDTGVANAYAATVSASATSYAGMAVLLKVGASNTGACTLNITPQGGAALGALPIKKMVSGVLVNPSAAELPTGGVVVLVYDGACFQLASGASSQSAADIGYLAGWAYDGVGEDLRVQSYGSVKLARAVTIEGEVSDAGLAPTGAAIIMDVERDGVSIYTVKPQIAAGATVLTAGTIDPTKAACPAGTVLTYKVIQVGSTIRGQQLHFTLKARAV